MQFGLALDLGAHDEDLATRLAATRALMATAEPYGFGSVWLGETYPTGEGYFHISSPLVAIAALAAGSTMTLGTGVTLLSAWDPLRLAYDLAVLDNLTGGGRLVLGAAVGGPHVWARFGMPREGLAERMDDTVRALRALWGGADGYAGPAIQIAGGVRPLPVTPGGPPIWWGGSAGRAVRRAADLADGWYAATNYRLADVARVAGAYRERVARAGDGQVATVAVNRMAAIHDSRDAALAAYGPAFTDLANIYARLGALSGDDGAPLGPSGGILGEVADEVMLIGSADEVNAQVEQYDRAGVTHLQIRLRPAGVSLEAATEMVTRFGEDVIPNWR